MHNKRVIALVIAIGFSFFAAAGVIVLLALAAQAERNVTARGFEERGIRKPRSSPVSTAKETKDSVGSPAPLPQLPRHNAADLYREYRALPALAQREYTHKRFDVTGAVKGVVLGEKGRVTLYLQVDDEVDSQPYEGGVRCDFPRELLSAIANVSPGHRVHVRGTCQGLSKPDTILFSQCTDCVPAE